MVPRDNAHIFALYTELVNSLTQSARRDLYELHDPDLLYRLIVVLRLEKGDSFILFNAMQHITVTIVAVEGRKALALQIKEIHPNKQLTPEIHWILPLLKREAFEEALYTLTEVGATSIQPIITAKTARIWGGEKEVLRSKKIVLAAAEQSKQFCVPVLLPIIPFDLWLMKSYVPSAAKLFFDPQGIPFKNVLAELDMQKSQEIIAVSGPEGDLTSEEKRRLQDQGFTFCALTPTVLRAQQAIAIGLGALRSYLR